jgi:hypothetical protein
MIGFARSVQNDIGPRAMAAFQQAVRVSEKPPTAAGLRAISKQMHEQLKASKTGEVQGPGTGGPLTPQGGVQAEYNALRKGGMSPEQAKEALTKRGYQVQ